MAQVWVFALSVPMGSLGAELIAGSVSLRPLTSPLLAACLTATLFTGCALLPSQREISATDAGYIINQSRGLASGSVSPGIAFYQQFASQTLVSRCRWAPSDSRYARQVAASCGPFQSLVMATARFLNESDAHALGRPFVAHDQKLSFFDPEGTCWFISK